MRGVALGLALAVTVLVTAVAGQGEQQQARPKPAVFPAKENLSLSPELNDRSRFFLGKYSTTTYTEVVMATSTVFFSCLSGTAAAVCQGRRKRDLRTFLEIDDDGNDLELESGQLDLTREAREAPDLKDLEPTPDDSDQASSKILGFNVWTTTRTTTTVTMLYTNTSTTIRLSYFCVAGQIQFPANACAG